MIKNFKMFSGQNEYNCQDSSKSLQYLANKDEKISFASEAEKTTRHKLGLPG